MTGLAKNNRKFRQWMSKAGIKATTVSGAGLNCLINSLIQHATGNYDVSNFSGAAIIRNHLSEKFPKLSRMLHDDDASTMFVVEQVNKVFNVNLRICFVQAYENGCPFITSFVGNKNGNPVVVWQQGMHYVGLVPSSPRHVFETVVANTPKPKTKSRVGSGRQDVGSDDRSILGKRKRQESSENLDHPHQDKKRKL